MIISLINNFKLNGDILLYPIVITDPENKKCTYVLTEICNSCIINSNYDIFSILIGIGDVLKKYEHLLPIKEKQY